MDKEELKNELVSIHGSKLLILIKKAHFMVDKIFYW